MCQNFGSYLSKLYTTVLQIPHLYISEGESNEDGYLNGSQNSPTHSTAHNYLQSSYLEPWTMYRSIPAKFVGDYSAFHSKHSE